MRILAIESSAVTASVAIMDETTLVAEYTINHKMTHSQTLLPMIDQMMKMLEIELDTVDAIAVSGGPGSFTGLRIGSATAKGLGMALKKPLIHVPTVDAMGYSLYGVSHLICPIMDARRKQVYTGIYRFKNHQLVALKEQWAAPIEELLDELNQRGEMVTLLGDGVPVFRELIAEKLHVPYSFAPAHVNKQRAAAVAALGSIYYKEGRTETAMEHVPEYLRVSQAERERAEREKAQKQAGAEA